MTDLLLILLFVTWLFSIVLAIWRRGIVWLIVSISIPIMLYFEGIDILLIIPMVVVDIGLAINFMREIGV